MSKETIAEQAAQMKPVPLLPPNAPIWAMRQEVLDSMVHEPKAAATMFPLIFGVEVRVNPDMPRNRIAAVDRDGNVLGVIELDIATVSNTGAHDGGGQ
jgi:hypothetical protein